MKIEAIEWKWRALMNKILLIIIHWALLTKKYVAVTETKSKWLK